MSLFAIPRVAVKKTKPVRNNTLMYKFFVARFTLGRSLYASATSYPSHCDGPLFKYTNLPSQFPTLVNSINELSEKGHRLYPCHA